MTTILFQYSPPISKDRSTSEYAHVSEVMMGRLQTTPTDHGKWHVITSGGGRFHHQDTNDLAL